MNTKLSRMKLLPPAPRLLGIAENVLRDEKHLATVADAENVSHVAMVSAMGVDIRLDEICHACCYSMVSDQGGRMYRVRYTDDVAKYWNTESRKWQADPVFLPRPERAVYPYRYLCTFTNPKHMPEYRDGNAFTDDEEKAIAAWLDFLRNKSMFSRFFAGPSDPVFMRRNGCILDMSAPSAVVHFLAVAWRIPGEWIEMVQRWHHLANTVKIEPHLALGLAQGVAGWPGLPYNDEVDDVEEGLMGELVPPGHNLLYGIVSVETLARLKAGVLDIPMDERQARKAYSTANNSAFGNALSWKAGVPVPTWLEAVGKKVGHCKKQKDIWGAYRESYSPQSKLFANRRSRGFTAVNKLVDTYIKERKWNV